MGSQILRQSDGVSPPSSPLSGSRCGKFASLTVRSEAEYGRWDTVYPHGAASRFQQADGFLLGYLQRRDLAHWAGEWGACRTSMRKLL